MLYGGCFTRIKHDERERMTMLEFCELPKRKKEREKKNINKIKKMKRNKNKTEEEGRNLFFFFSVWNVNLGRDNRMRKILRWSVRFVRVHVCLARRYCGKYLRDRKKDSDDCLRLNFLFFFSFFFPFRLIARIARYPRRVCRVSRVRVRNCVVLRICVRARGCKYNN